MLHNILRLLRRGSCKESLRRVAFANYNAERKYLVIAKNYLHVKNILDAKLNVHLSF